MPNSVITVKNAPGIIAKSAAKMMADKCLFSKSIDVADESDFNGKNGYQAGDTIYISKPARFIPTTAEDVTSALQDIKEEKVALALDTYRVVPMVLGTQEMATDMSLKNWMNRVLEPAVSSIAQHVDLAFLDKAVKATYNLVGTAGSTVFDTDTMLAAGAKITEMGCPDLDSRYALLNSQAQRSATNARKGLYQSSTEIADQYKKGYVGTADGFDFLTSNLLPVITNGTATGSLTVTTTSTTGATTLALTGTGTQTLKAGQVFTIASVFAVHPITKVAYPYLQQFVVTADNTASGGAYTGVAVSPTIYGPTSGSLQNVSALPQGSAVVTLVGSASTAYGQSISYYKTAFRRVSVPLVLPAGMNTAAQETYEGHTIRVLSDFDILTGKMIMRLDYLGGLSAVRPEWATRITA
jgi:hypothetical protein